jgi:hypothetical protein
MPYRKPHPNCSENNCQSYSAYIRVQKKWIKAGEYNSECHTFTPDENVKTYDEVKRENFQAKYGERLDYLEKLFGKV